MALSTYHAGLAAGECLLSLVDTGWLLGPESGALAPLVRLCVASYLGIIEELSVLLHLRRGLLEPLRGVASCLTVSLLSASRATSRAASWEGSLHGRTCSSSAALPLKGLLDLLPETCGLDFGAILLICRVEFVEPLLGQEHPKAEHLRSKQCPCSPHGDLVSKSLVTCSPPLFRQSRYLCGGGSD
jgi:hypothetical protein